MKKILIADDFAGILEMLSSELGNIGYEVLTANNGKEALYQADNWQPDLILTDITMPVMNGFEMLKKLRQYSNTPVIAYSFDGSNKPIALKMGANDFILKPFEMDILINKIECYTNLAQ